jgi:elongation factor Ts
MGVMEITAAMVKQLRENTGAGMMQCKQALAETGGDVQKATEALRKMGLASVAKRSDRIAAEGRVEAYIHPGNRIGVLVEVNCETDFVARTDDFIRFSKELALQVAATSPKWVTIEGVPPPVIDEQKTLAREKLSSEGVSGADLEERITREVDRFYEEHVLLKQPGIRDASKSVGDALLDLAAKLGENLRVSRFSYFRLGGAS